MIRPQAAKARRTGARDPIARHVIGPDFRHHENAIALIGNNAADQFLGAAVAVEFRRIDQGHAERDAGAQCLFLLGRRMPPLAQPCRSLTERRHDGAIRKFDRSRRGLRGRATGLSRCRRSRRAQSAEGGQRQAERRGVSIDLAPRQHRLTSSGHDSITARSVPPSGDCRNRATCCGLPPRFVGRRPLAWPRPTANGIAAG